MALSIIEALDTAGLTGRGGSAFPTAVKLAAAQRAGAELIINACDGEIGAAKDSYVLRRYLSHVDHGAQLTQLTRFIPVIYAVHAGTDVEKFLLAQGKKVLPVPDRYVSSEASSLVALQHGRPARPMAKRTRLVEGGRTSDGKKTRPTLVMNAETVLRIAQIEQHGPTWFRSFGTPAEPGPRLITITGAVFSPGVYETQAGPALTDILALAGYVHRSSPALNIGGLGGSFIPMDQVPDLAYSSPSLATAGAAIGPGIINVLAPGSCPVRTIAGMLTWAAGESAGQCGPCMFGVPAVARGFQQLADGTAGPGVLHDLARHISLLPGRGACHFPDGVAAFTASAVNVFSAHLEEHRNGHCTIGQPGAAA
ncbi:NADH-ubiquinone oxidoreductase-F iron-sulfur binding region domain-containing protein [Arthrobacter sp. B1805]|uniref:NADH-ubiquinone oxidoreductase-F iron-sulfur binding region domain-containing protein n=1 Tax=Arthrobacter sp. B1805 TaxID=2058892 RepID=UPI0021573A30|nr:NADH-ubiquinone oxidoreductase-F iron-sulfur binding region domain-containing protein [Arthrobacter sp. B1805]